MRGFESISLYALGTVSLTTFPVSYHIMTNQRHTKGLTDSYKQLLFVCFNKDGMLMKILMCHQENYATKKSR